MGYQGNYHSRRFCKAARSQAWARATGADGVTRCENCTKAVTRQTAAFDHRIAWELCFYSGPSNCQVLCDDGPTSCHTIKTAQHDIPEIAKRRRLGKPRKRPRHPLPCGKRSGWSKPVHGGAVRRIGAEAKHRAAMTHDRSETLRAKFAAFQAKRGLLIEQLER